VPRRLAGAFARGFILAVLLGAGLPAWGQNFPERVSLGPGGIQANDDINNFYPLALSANGRFVAFSSEADNLVPGDTNGGEDVFVRDRRTGVTERISVGPNGVQGNADSFGPALSANGRFVAFSSYASNLVPNDTNLTGSVYVHDRRTGLTERVNIDSILAPVLSADGRFIAVWSSADNLVPGDTNGASDVFVHDRRTGATERVNLGPDGVQADSNASVSSPPALSADGRLVAFPSRAGNLVPGDTNDARDVFVRDRRTGVTERISVGPNGVQGNDHSSSPALSADGRFVAFTSQASNLVPGDTNDARDVFVHDRRTGATERVSVGPNGVQGDKQSSSLALSADGRFVAFTSEAGNLVPDDNNASTDVFVHDRRTGRTERVSVGPNGEGHDYSSDPALSADGRFVAFVSNALNLVPGDTNNVKDAFVRRLTGGR
jgi:Tol biopolymer transport system component